MRRHKQSERAPSILINTEKMEEEIEENEECEDDEEDQDEEWWDKAEAEEDWGEKDGEPVEVWPVDKKQKIFSNKSETKINYESLKPRRKDLESFALAIQEHEGWFLPSPNRPKGSTSFRNNNPGNLKFAGQREAIGKDERGFAIFGDYNAGLRALQNDIDSKIRRHPEWNFEDFFKIYAPASDSNRPLQYASAVAQKLGVSAKTNLNVLFS